MSERRYSPLATLFAATFLFRIGNAVAALALPWFVLSHTKSAAWAGATAAGTVAKLAMRQPFVLFKGLTFQKLCLPGAFRPGDHHNK
ncbi:hypothetical protein MU781_23500, partial [Salmonella enterica subsp. enterica serovar Enteritidis]|nr:hypothetical protein [Salmonella enterica subsp. enterica serovar Enteritidis]